MATMQINKIFYINLHVRQIFIFMNDTEVSRAGQLVTVKKEIYAIPAKFFEGPDAGRQTIYAWDNIPIKPGTIGLVLNFTTYAVIFAKILWTIDGEGVTLYAPTDNLILLNYFDKEEND